MTKKKLPLIIAAVVGVLLIVGGVFWWMDKSRWEATENAYIQADMVTVSPQVTGYVSEVLVTDNQVVEPGQVLARLDPAEAQAAVAEAEANVAALEAAVQNVNARASLSQSEIAEQAAGVASAQAKARMAEADLDRYGKLADRGWAAPQRLQSVRAAADEAKAAVAQANAGLETQRRMASTFGSTRAQTQAQVEQARAALAQARLNLDRTIIRAPAAGVVGARGVRPGQYVRPGGALMSIVPLGRTYVVANFKETQVGRLRIGQIVTVHADAFPGREFKGRVESFAPATGSEFALIPVENDVGNFTKIVQRVPVKILIDPRDPLSGALRPGLSVKVKVDRKSAGTLTFADTASLATVPSYADAAR